ncbi:M16 family metallopeptidase [Nonlabens ulvanivorans]|uniref:Peptidase M16 n=1 Tax=Nonlabens ulvanivorans TaxID=906888 RepID=A0A084JYL4_NONUL|nr:pitrilysin family protein [Nonlabens ulvanivorans]KEZ94048.1 peptidase M16 [Nonlabens ulvanivorans]PRX13034.1 zinc protease [Nonlabens ulvanivorans]
MNIRYFAALCMVAFLLSCKNDKVVTQDNDEVTLDVAFEKMTLDNGLTVILHQDHSDPVAAVALTVHVGSAREKEGRTGFAHLFEHLLFLESENLGKGGLDAMSARIGGSGANGSTSRDRTNYYQTVPKDALEKMIWAEADKLGWFVNTVTDPVLAKEKQVVKNEKRQSVDNRPYGHVRYVVGKNLYPKDHPYNWQVIGSLEDLQNATLDDVKEFYRRWYTPNNTVLTIAGDFDMEQTKAWVHKYFDEIPAGEEVSPLAKRPVTIDTTKKLYYEDNFARVPQLMYTWPTVAEYDEDAYALDILTQYLSSGKKAPLNKVLVDQEQLTSNVTMYNYGSELAGETTISINAFNGTALDSVAAALDKGLALFEKDGISQADLDRIKAGQETSFYRGLSSALGKGFQLAQYEMFAGDAGFVSQDVKNILNVTREDVMRVYEKYIKGKPYIATSFVPRDQKDLILTGSTLAEVVEEQIIPGAEESFDASIKATYEKTPSTFDRSVEPSYGEAPSLKTPDVWQDELSSGMKYYGITSNEVPLVEFSMDIKGGMLLEDIDKVGVSNLLADLMMRGTATKTPEELENAIESLGASIYFYAGDQSITVAGTTLARNYDKTMALVQEMILEPRFDETEFELLKQDVLSQIEQRKANPNAIASNEFSKLLYGENNILSRNGAGTEQSVQSITIQDLKDYYNNYVASNLATFKFVGAIDESKAASSLKSLNESWTTKDVVFPELPEVNRPDKAAVYFYDVPGAKQSVINFGYPALKATDKDFYAAQVMNYRLGGGSFASQLTQQLREGKGYTYGIGSRFGGTDLAGSFSVSSSVRTNVTYESAALVKEIIGQYGTGFTAEDLEVTKSYMIKSNARRLETASAKLGMLDNMSTYGFDKDYLKKREQEVENMTIEDVKRLSSEYLNPDQMIYLIVGDAASQMNRMKDLGYGVPILLNPETNELKK